MRPDFFPTGRTQKIHAFSRFIATFLVNLMVGKPLIAENKFKIRKKSEARSVRPDFFYETQYGDYATRGTVYGGLEGAPIAGGHIELPPPPGLFSAGE